MLPENTKLGTLEYLEIYDFYDTLQFFSCKNERDEIYLALAVDSKPLTYLFARVDSDVLELAEDTNTLPANIIWLHGYIIHKIEFLPTEDVVSYISESELNHLLGRK